MKEKFKILLLLISLFIVSCSMFAYSNGWIMNNGEWYYEEEQGQYATETIKISGDKKYYLDENGRMVRDYILENYNDSIYYFDENGEMVTNTWVAVEPNQVSNPIENGPTVYLYYFGPSGRAYKAESTIAKKTIDGKKYMFDSQGRMLTGWFNEEGEMFVESIDSTEDPFVDCIYYAGDETDGVLREGWHCYEQGSINDKYYEKEQIWLYFNKTNNKKVFNNTGGEYLKKKIDGQTYAFDENGIMLTGFEASKATYYFSEDLENYGPMAKNKWVFAVPSEELQKDDHDSDTKRWFYADKSGELKKNMMKKINGKYYAFDQSGILKDGLVIFDKFNKTYIGKVDLDETDAKTFMIESKYIDYATKTEKLFDDALQVLYYFSSEDSEGEGAREKGTSLVPFADNDYTFVSNNAGAYQGLKSHKFYRNGILLKPESIVGLGLVAYGMASPSELGEDVRDIKVSGGDTNPNEYEVYYDRSKYVTEYYPRLYVVTKDGKKVTKSNYFKKDIDANYWIIGPSSLFEKIVSVPVKYNKSKGWTFKSEFFTENNRTKTQYQPFGTYDIYSKTVEFARGDGDYEVTPIDLYALNFKWKLD